MKQGIFIIHNHDTSKGHGISWWYPYAWKFKGHMYEFILASGFLNSCMSSQADRYMIIWIHSTSSGYMDPISWLWIPSPSSQFEFKTESQVEPNIMFWFNFWIQLWNIRHDFVVMNFITDILANLEVRIESYWFMTTGSWIHATMCDICPWCPQFTQVDHFSWIHVRVHATSWIMTIFNSKFMFDIIFEKYCEEYHVEKRGFSLVDEVWNTLTAVLNFGVLKRIQTPHSLFNFILGFQSR